MTIARVKSVASPLPDGDVLIAGGTGASAEKSAVLFNPTTKAFTAVAGTEHVAREAAVAGLLADGQVLIAGGTGSETSAETFIPSKQTFEALPSSPPNTELRLARVAASAAPLSDGQILIAGGSSSSTTAELFFSAPQAMVAGGTFGYQTVSQASAVSIVVVTNLGAQALSLGNVSLGGTNPGDFTVSGETCSGRMLAYEQSCTISVHFTPAGTGMRSASITVPDNEPAEQHLTIALAGTGVAANAGPAGQNGTSGSNGQQGATGATGPTGPTGSRGPAGRPARSSSSPAPARSRPSITNPRRSRSAPRVRSRPRRPSRRASSSARRSAGMGSCMRVAPLRRGAWCCTPDGHWSRGAIR